MEDSTNSAAASAAICFSLSMLTPSRLRARGGADAPDDDGRRRFWQAPGCTTRTQTYDEQKEDDMADSTQTTADVLVIFGITGDLAKKMTFRSLYRLERRKMLACPIIGVARDRWSPDQLRDHARQAIIDSGEQLDEKVFGRLCARFSTVSGDYTNNATYA